MPKCRQTYRRLRQSIYIYLCKSSASCQPFEKIIVIFIPEIEINCQFFIFKIEIFVTNCCFAENSSLNCHSIDLTMLKSRNLSFVNFFSRDLFCPISGSRKPREAEMGVGRRGNENKRSLGNYNLMYFHFKFSFFTF